MKEQFYQVRFVANEQDVFKIIPPDSKDPFSKAEADMKFWLEEDPSLKERVVFINEK